VQQQPRTDVDACSRYLAAKLTNRTILEQKDKNPFTPVSDILLETPPGKLLYIQTTEVGEQKKMGNNVKVGIFLIVILLTSWSTATDALSNVVLSNMKSFTAGGVGGKRKLVSIHSSQRKQKSTIVWCY
jgi:hypothetical protein